MNRRVLVVTSWAPPMIGGPQNLYNLLSQFPANSYTVLTSFLTLQLSGTKRGKWLPAQYVFFDHPGPVDRDADITPRNTQRRPLRLRITQRAMALAKHIPALGAVLFQLDSITRIVQMTTAGVRRLRQSQENFILGISDTGPALVSTYLIALFTGAHYAVYLYDIYWGNNLTLLNKWMAFLFEKRIIRRARLVILTNEATQQLYRKRYGSGIRTCVIHNSVFAADYEKAREPYKHRPPFRLVFTGHVYWAQEQAVMNVIKAMDRLRDLPVKLDLYIPNASGALRNEAGKRGNIQISSAPPSEMPAIQCTATLLILPLAWNTKSPQIIATASPGKFIDYLAAGRPMLVHAPDYAYVAQHARAHNLGLVVDKDDATLIAQTIREFLDDPNSGRQYVENSLKIFYRNHDAGKNGRRLMRLLGIRVQRQEYRP